MLTARIQNQMLTVTLLLDVSIFDWARLEATTNPSHTSKLWCMIVIDMSTTVSINKMQYLFILNIVNVYIKNIWASRCCLYGTGLLTGCGQKWGIVRHYEGQLCSKKDQLCGNQLLISKTLGGAKWCFDLYFSLFK